MRDRASSRPPRRLPARGRARSAPRGTWAIILAAGSASRFGGGKQFARLGGERLIDRVVRTAASACDAVVVVLPENIAWNGPPVAAAVPGGLTRAASVRCGLAAVPVTAGIVVVHDAAHPLATPTLFASVLARVRAGADAAAPALPSGETFARVRDGVIVATEPRQALMLLQTPHAFRAQVLRVAHAQGPEATDDVSLLVSLGRRVETVKGDPRNIHITAPEDLELAARLLNFPPFP
jgi:2-C-methyl-D-erythritol 4-phosphate cytidylyltransferase